MLKSFTLYAAVLVIYYIHIDASYIYNSKPECLDYDLDLCLILGLATEDLDLKFHCSDPIFGHFPTISVERRLHTEN